MCQLRNFLKKIPIYHAYLFTLFFKNFGISILKYRKLKKAKNAKFRDFLVLYVVWISSYQNLNITTQ